jgi:allophanate hydrolase subunit 1
MPLSYKFQNFEIQSAILSERVLLLSVGAQINPDFNKLIHKIALAIKGALIPGIGECIPAYASLSIHFDPQVVRSHFPDQLPAGY